MDLSTDPKDFLPLNLEGLYSCLVGDKFNYNEGGKYFIAKSTGSKCNIFHNSQGRSASCVGSIERRRGTIDDLADGAPFEFVIKIKEDLPLPGGETLPRGKIVVSYDGSRLTRQNIEGFGLCRFLESLFYISEPSDMRGKPSYDELLPNNRLIRPEYLPSSKDN